MDAARNSCVHVWALLNGCTELLQYKNKTNLTDLHKFVIEIAIIKLELSNVLSIADFKS